MSDPSGDDVLTTVWTRAAAPHAGTWFTARAGSWVAVLAPPGVPLSTTEPQDEQDVWRLAETRGDEGGWLSREDGQALWQQARSLTIAEVLDNVGDNHREWVIRHAREQYRALLAFSCSEPGTLIDEERAREAGRLLNALREELAEALPGEGWYAARRPPRPPVPEPDELLAAMTARSSLRPPARPSRLVRIILAVRGVLPHNVVGDVLNRLGGKTVRTLPVLKDNQPAMGELRYQDRGLAASAPAPAPPPPPAVLTPSSDG